MIKPQTLKGFRDFLPKVAGKRQYVIGVFKKIFERFGFDPLETPALEYADTLLGKYGNEADKLLYLFKDNGGRNVGLRYDQTVPLSRVVAQYANDIPLPFKRYQIQPVWRAENTQKGRFREFLQCDIDTVGTDSPLADAEIITCALTVSKELGFNATMYINDRTIFNPIGLAKSAMATLDKLAKIGKDAVLEELRQKNVAEADKIFTAISASPKTSALINIFNILTNNGFVEDKDFVFDRFLARGLDYYTSTIFELKLNEYSGGSIAGGGRYDNLIGQFTGKNQPAVGIAFGFDRVMEAMAERNLLNNSATVTDVLVTVFSGQLAEDSLKITAILRNKGINAEVYLEETKLDKQLKYADRKGIPYAIIVGPEEKAKNVVKLKNLQTKEQEELTVEAVIDKLTKAS